VSITSFTLDISNNYFNFFFLAHSFARCDLAHSERPHSAPHFENIQREIAFRPDLGRVPGLLIDKTKRLGANLLKQSGTTHDVKDSTPIGKLLLFRFF
jgi:hypothetical protein